MLLRGIKGVVVGVIGVTGVRGAVVVEPEEDAQESVGLDKSYPNSSWSSSPKVEDTSQ